MGTQYDPILRKLKSNKFKKIELNTGYSKNGLEKVGTMFWDSTKGTASLVTEGGTVLDLGNETRYYGKASGDILNGQLVQFAGQQGDHVLFKVAVPAEIEANPQYLMGIATQDIDNGDFGMVTRFGYVNDITTYDWNAGDLLWYDKTTGQLTNTEPEAPDRRILIAAVIKEETGSSQNGIILVRLTWGIKMTDLDDVNGEALVKSGQLPVWMNDNNCFDFVKNIDDYEVKSLESNEIITNFESGHGFIKQSTAGTQTDDTTDYQVGSQSLKLTTDGDNAVVFTRKSSISPAIDLTDKYLRLWIKIDDVAKVSECTIYIGTGNLSTGFYYWTLKDDISYFKDGVWTQVTIPFGDSTSSGSPERDNLNSIQLRVRDNGTGAVNFWFDGMWSEKQPLNETVCLTFDDGWDSVYTEAMKKMDQYGYRGTAYLMESTIGTANYMTEAQVETLNQKGWCIGGHYATNLSTLTDEEVEEATSQTQDWLMRKGWKGGHYAYPNGAFSTDIINRVKKYFKSARTIVDYGETRTPADRYKLRTYNVVNTTTLAQVEAEIVKAQANKELLILIFHKIVTTPGASTEWSITNFQGLIDYIHTNNVNIKTIDEALKSDEIKDGIKKFGDVENGNYSEFEKDGTLKAVGNATTWDDQQVNLGQVKLGSSSPTWTDYKGGQILSFDKAQDNKIYFNIQFSHKLKLGTNIEFHIHTAVPDNNSGDVVWSLTVSFADLTGTFPTETTYPATQTVAANSLDKHYLTEIEDNIGQAGGVSSLAICSLTRVGTDAGDTYDNNIYLIALDCHIEQDTVGSREETSK